MKNIKKQFTRNLLNIPGWHTKRKIVVIESDDWGSIRMPSRKVFEYLVKKGIRVDKLSYNRYDSLASQEDLTALFEILNSVRDKNGNPAIITANTIVANPDFEKIKQSAYHDYYYEPFTTTLARYSNHSNSFNLWKEGMSAGVFRPQFHGREHINIPRWLKSLREDIGNVRLGFENRMFDLSESLTISENSFMEALNYQSTDELLFQEKSIIEGTKLFNELFGYNSSTFIAPCYTWSPQLNKTLKENGIESYQGIWYQFMPLSGNKHSFKKIFHYTGQKNKMNQIYSVRNVTFEPSQNPNFDFISDSLTRIETAFRWGKPAIIGAHRLNFIGYIDPSNRNRNLPMLAQLLKEIIRKWPQTEFMSSDSLSNTILKKNK